MQNPGGMVVTGPCEARRDADARYRAGTKGAERIKANGVAINSPAMRAKQSTANLALLLQDMVLAFHERG